MARICKKVCSFMVTIAAKRTDLLVLLRHILYKQSVNDKIRGVFFRFCHLLDYFSRGLITRMLFACGESPIFF